MTPPPLDKPRKEGKLMIQTIMWDLDAPTRYEQLKRLVTYPTIQDATLIGNEKTGRVSIKIDFSVTPD